MDLVNDLRSLAAVVVTVVFLGICWWAYSPKRNKRFEEAANLPFADDEITGQPESINTPASGSALNKE